MVPKSAEDFMMALGMKIQVITIFPCGTGQPHGIDVIRALLERLYIESALAKRAAEANAQSGFARRFVGGGNEQVSHVVPCVKRVLAFNLNSVVQNNPWLLYMPHIHSV